MENKKIVYYILGLIICLGIAVIYNKKHCCKKKNSDTSMAGKSCSITNKKMTNSNMSSSLKNTTNISADTRNNSRNSKRDIAAILNLIPGPTNPKLEQMITVKDVNAPTRKQFNAVTVYHKQNCSFCRYALVLLTLNDIAYKMIDISDMNTQAITDLNMKTNNYKKFPAIFIGNDFIGGFTDLVELDNKGLLEAKVFQVLEQQTINSVAPVTSTQLSNNEQNN